MKIKAAAEIGIDAKHVRYPDTISEIELLCEIKKLNDDPAIHGIIVQVSAFLWSWKTQKKIPLSLMTLKILEGK